MFCKIINVFKGASKRVFHCVKSFPIFLFEFGFKMALVNSFEFVTSKRFGYSNRFIRCTQKCIENDLRDFVEFFKKKHYEIPNTFEKKYVWVCWWQGYNSMPPIVSTCIKRIKEAFREEDYEVVLITKDNYSQYLKINSELLLKFKKGKYTLAHLADILRWGLVSIYGGMWIDATVYLTSSFSISKYHFFFEQPFFTQRFTDEKECPYEPCKGKWNNFYFIGNPRMTSFFKFVYEALLYYWQKHNVLINYVILDYIIMTGYKKFDEYKKIIDSVVPNNKNLWILLDVLNKKFDRGEWERLEEANDFYKLTYKCPFKEKDSNGSITFFGYILQTNKNGKNFCYKS